MQQSSGSIGSLAAALARAQVELINPEKSMVATIRPEGRGAAEQIFRYAPLSDGLNIIRKTLGQHPEDAQQATGHGVRAKRSKSGAITLELLNAEDSHAAV